MKFNCEHCGYSIKVDDSLAGKRGLCPDCKEVVTVPVCDPSVEIELQLVEDSGTFPSIEQQHGTDSQGSGVFDYNLQDATDRSRAAHIEQSERIGQTGHNAFVEILAYPMSQTAWIILTVFVGVPAAGDLIQYLMKVTPGMLMFLYIPLLLIAWMVSFTVSVYMFWYFGYCIQQSALGSAKMPDSLIEDNGFWDMFKAMLRVLSCVAICLGPSMVCFYQDQKLNVTVVSVLAAGVFFSAYGVYDDVAVRFYRGA